MTAPSCDLVRPRSLTDALEAKAERPELRVLAGGTDLMVLFELGLGLPEAVLDIWAVDEMRGIEARAGSLRIGALTTYTELIDHPAVQGHLPILAEASAAVGAVQIQNRGTLGGNVVNASPAADGVPPLLALNADLELASASGHRRLPLEDFYAGYKETHLAQDELLVAIHVPLPPTDGIQWFRKVGTRRAQSIAKVVGAATAVRTEGGRLSDARIFLGSVGPTAVRLRRTEALLEGRVPSRQLADQVRVVAREEIAPIDDVRSTARYRRQVSGSIVARWLSGLADHPSPGS